MGVRCTTTFVPDPLAQLRICKAHTSHNLTHSLALSFTKRGLKSRLTIMSKVCNKIRNEAKDSMYPRFRNQRVGELAKPLDA